MPSFLTSSNLSLLVVLFVGCFVLFFGFYTSCKPLIVFEMPVNLFHCTFHCSMPDDTKNNSGLKGK